MRWWLGLPLTAGILLSFGLLHHEVPHCRLTLELIDARTAETLPGLVQIHTSDGTPVRLEELLNRGQGLADNAPISRWWVLPGRSTVEVPAERLKLKAFSGLETEVADVEVDLTGKREHALKVPLVRFYDTQRSGYVAGNTHLHLRKLSKEQADRYLREAPLVDGLDVVYVSYLERAKDDLEYTSNNYTPHDLEHLSTDHVHFGHGQEHRHNFGAYGEGYGHILFLDMPVIVRPVSIGPGITAAGTDAPPLRQGIDEARRQGGKVIWAHNMYGFEDIPNWLSGRVHANNIFDGGTHGSYKESFYRYLNIGLKVPFSTGTDWFIYDFSRVYAMTEKPVTPRQWLDLLAEGKTYITNGPLLEFTVDDKPIASTLELQAPAGAARSCASRGTDRFSAHRAGSEWGSRGTVEEPRGGGSLRRGLRRAAAHRCPLLAGTAHAAASGAQRSCAASPSACERIWRAAVCPHQSHLCANVGARRLRPCDVREAACGNTAQYRGDQAAGRVRG